MTAAETAGEPKVPVAAALESPKAGAAAGAGDPNSEGVWKAPKAPAALVTEGDAPELTLAKVGAPPKAKATGAVVAAGVGAAGKVEPVAAAKPVKAGATGWLL